MPYDDPDATDPMTLHGVVVETTSDAAMRDMAECFVEEYIRSGFSAERILKMFQTQGYAGAFLAYRTLGEDAVRNIIDELIPLWGGRKEKAVQESSSEVRMSLPVLER